MEHFRRYWKTGAGDDPDLTRLLLLVGCLSAIRTDGPMNATDFAKPGSGEEPAAAWLEHHALLRVVGEDVHLTGAGMEFLDELAPVLTGLAGHCQPQIPTVPDGVDTSKN